MNRTAPTFHNIRGKLAYDEPLHTKTWLGVGGIADLYFEPVDDADLAQFITQLPDDIPRVILGAGSNMLVRDGGIDGVVIRLTGSFATITHNMDKQGATFITAGAGTSDAELARYGARHDLGGLSFLVSIPGTIGGGLRMNAGCYGSEFKDVVITARLMDSSGKIHEMTPVEMGMAYRHSDVPDDMIFLSARFATKPEDGQALRQEMKQMLAMRAQTQPQGVRTGGSTFANPDGHKAWQVIDQAGCRGLRIGDAGMSEKHCNFLINHGAATADDIETLGETVRARVAETSGVHLRWEIKRIGRIAQNDQPEMIMTKTVKGHKDGTS